MLPWVSILYCQYEGDLTSHSHNVHITISKSMDVDLFAVAGFTGERFSNPEIVTYHTCKDLGNLAMSDSMRQELDNDGEGFADVHR